jgi:uncharacterized protein YciI
MPHYIYLIHPLRHEFFDKPTPAEDATMQAHFQYLSLGINTGSVLLAGPCLDETFGLIVLQAEDEAAARDFMYHDPAVKANVMIAELHPFRLSLKSWD